MMRTWAKHDTARLVRVRTEQDDKYSRGVVGLYTGSAQYPGAAVLGVEAAWRSGAGYVRYCGTAGTAVVARRPETVVSARQIDASVGCWVIGSGMDAAQRSEEEHADLQQLLAGHIPVVTDAGALDLAPGASAPRVLTPHSGELARLVTQLGGEPVAKTASIAEQAAQLGALATMMRAVIVRKGATTLIAAPDVTPIAVTNGPGWLATAGTGDVLAGIAGTLIAANPGVPLQEAAAGAVWLHGHAAAIAAGTDGGAAGHPIVAMDVAVALPAAVGSLLR